MSRHAARIVLIAGLTVGVMLALEGSASARKTGIAAQGCDGCHGGGKPPTVTLTASPESPAVGQMVTLTVSVAATNGSVAGFFLTTSSPAGQFSVLESGTVASTAGVFHTTPRAASGGTTTFKVGWSTSSPRGAQFLAYALSANNDGTPRGDAGGQATLSLVSGCAGQNYYLDQDGDGYGTSDPVYPVLKDCSQPMGYALAAGDCDDFRAAVHPGAVEQCDGKDNDCDGMKDDNVVSQMYCQDKDGDGHGVTEGLTKLDCAPSAGFGDCGGDCDDSDPTVYPGAPELCNGHDDNCDSKADEGVRQTCGVGWCRRYATGCTSLCTPGDPLVESCNLFDDDCDGIVDNGTDLELCGRPGMACVSGSCIAGGGRGSGGDSGVGTDGGTDVGTDVGADLGAAGAGGGDPVNGGSGGSASTGAAGSAQAGRSGCAVIPEPTEPNFPFPFLLLAASIATRRRRRDFVAPPEGLRISVRCHGPHCARRIK